MPAASSFTRTPCKWLVAASYFRPDHAGIAIYSTDFVDYLVEHGGSVRVVTTFPFYPAWRKRPEDEGRLFRRDIEHGYEVFRGYSYVPGRVTALKRMWHEASCAIFGFLSCVRAGRVDVVVVFSPPIALCVISWLWARLTGATFVINVQDLPVDAARSLGMMQQGPLLRVIGAVESWVYRRTDQITTISHAMLAILRAKGVSEERLRLVPNWIDVARHGEAVAAGRFRATQGIASDAFVVAYAGNIGVKQGLDQLVRLAAHFRGRPDLVFVIAGEGADKPRIMQLVQELGADNVRVLPFLAPTDYRELLADSDLVFVAQRAGAGDNFFPSKLLGIMALARPLLITADAASELFIEATRAQCGYVAQYGEIAALAQAVESAIADPGKLREMGRNGAAWVRRFDRDEVLGSWTGSLGAVP
jgi:colanic acid biosynthesis glycosyl transferase WcaI